MLGWKKILNWGKMEKGSAKSWAEWNNFLQTSLQMQETTLQGIRGAHTIKEAIGQCTWETNNKLHPKRGKWYVDFTDGASKIHLRAETTQGTISIFTIDIIRRRFCSFCELHNIQREWQRCRLVCYNNGIWMIDPLPNALTEDTLIWIYGNLLLAG